MRRFLRLAILLGVSALVVVPAAFADDEYVFLTPEEQAKVVALVRGDPRIRAAIDDADVHVEDVLPWSADGTRETLMGGGVTLAFDSPRDLEADWPLMDFPDGPDRYTIAKLHYRVQDAAAIDAWVDLRKGRVVSFDVRDGTVDQSTIREVSPAVRNERSSARDDDGPGGSHSALVAALIMGSLLASGIALGTRYGAAAD